MSDIVEVDGEVVRRTADAVLWDDGSIEVWLPLSQIEVNEESGTVVMPEWLAIEKGLV